MKICKNGFTIIEVIICLVIIGIISTISIVTLTSKKNWDLEKNIKKVISSADVYYNSNKKSKNDLIDNGGYLVLTVNQLREQGLLEDKLLVDGIDITKYKDSMLDNVDYEKILLSSRNEEQQVFMYYPLYGTPINYSTIRYIYDKDLNNDVCDSKLKTNEDIYNCIKYNFFDTVYFYDKNFNKLFISESNGFNINELFYDNKNIEFDNLKNKYLTQKIELDDVSLEREIYVYSGPSLNVYDLNTNEKITDFDKWYNNVKIEISGIPNDKEAYLNNIFTSNLEVKKENSSSNLVDNNEIFYYFNENGKYIYSYNFNAISLDNTEIKYSDSISNSKYLNIDVVLPTIKYKNDNTYEITDDFSGIEHVYCTNTNEINNSNLISFTSNSTYNCDKKYIIAVDKAGNTTTYINNETKSIDDNDISIIPIKNSFSKFQVKLKNYNNYKDWLTVSLNLKDYTYSSYQGRLNNYFNNLEKNENNNEFTFEFDLKDILNQIMYYHGDSLDLYKNMTDNKKYNEFTVYVDFGVNQELKKRYLVNYSFDITDVSEYFSGERNSYQNESKVYIVTNDYFIFLNNVYGDCGYGVCSRNKYLYKVNINNDISSNEIDKEIGDSYQYWSDVCFNNKNGNFGYTKIIKNKKTNYNIYKCDINNKSCNFDYSSKYISSCDSDFEIDKYNFDTYNIKVDNNLIEKILFIVDKNYYMERKDGVSNRNADRYSISTDKLLQSKLFITNNEEYGIYFINRVRNSNTHLSYIKFKLTPIVEEVFR